MSAFPAQVTFNGTQGTITQIGYQGLWIEARVPEGATTGPICVTVMERLPR